MTSTDSKTADLYPLHLFDAQGVELEYMIVDRNSLDVRPVADALFRAAAGHDASDVQPDGPDGVIGWSNELALHVAELKTVRPVPSLEGLVDLFQRHVRTINDMLEPMGCRLLPTGMHPWMNPDRETRLWPHENNEVYAAFDRIFGCRGHGWGNLQSTHLNLPFANDDEFGRLHAATRLVLPLLPAIAASSPFADAKRMAAADYRLEVYRNNSQRVPMMTGGVIPEPVFAIDAYHRDILGRLYADLAPLDPDAVLRHEWANARGCIARFDRGSIEIRLLDIQECPLADLAILALVIEVIHAIVDERWFTYARQKQIPAEPLTAVLMDTIRAADQATIREPALLHAFGLDATPILAGDLWSRLLDAVLPHHPLWSPVLRRIIESGTLSARIIAATGPNPSRATLHDVYSELADCLQDGTLYRASS